MPKSSRNRGTTFALQVYDTREDNLITEAPLIFGSGLRVRVSAKLRIPGTGYAVYLPVEVSNIQVCCFCAVSPLRLVSLGPSAPMLACGGERGFIDRRPM